MRTYEEKRDLVDGRTNCLVVTDRALLYLLHAPCWKIVEEIWPFDHGRIEFRIDRATGEPWFIETNLNCNLWSGKTLARSAASLGRRAQMPDRQSGPVRIWRSACLASASGIANPPFRALHLPGHLRYRCRVNQPTRPTTFRESPTRNSRIDFSLRVRC